MCAEYPGRSVPWRECVARLDQLRAHGPTPTAFTFRHRFAPNGTSQG
ncbi:MAG: DUF3291 domain-containing protein [Iamia sp.]